MNRAEFERLALEHLDACYRLAFQLARHPDEAADLVQETYLRALRSVSAKEFDGATGADKAFIEKGGGLRSWLFTILHNVFYSRAARKARAPALSEDLDHSAADHPDQAPDSPPPAWDLKSLDWEHVDGRLKEAIESLSPEHREVLLLWGVEGMKYREIASVVGVPIGTVMSRLHRARSILAKDLEALREELGWKKGKVGSSESA